MSLISDNCDVSLQNCCVRQIYVPSICLFIIQLKSPTSPNRLNIRKKIASSVMKIVLNVMCEQ